MEGCTRACETLELVAEACVLITVRLLAQEYDEAMDKDRKLREFAAHLRNQLEDPKVSLMVQPSTVHRVVHHKFVGVHHGSRPRSAGPKRWPKTSAC